MAQTLDWNAGALRPAPPSPAVARGQAEPRALYLDATPAPVFAMAHLPANPDVHGTGVVLCSPFGWEDLCTYRARRAWACALADAGHPAIRFDFPGTGDSGGSARQPDQLGRWTASVASAAAWLRSETGCARVAGLGIGFGGMLAWLAAIEGAPIDDLILWAVPTSGRRLVREIRAAAMLSIDSRVAPDPALRPEPAGDGELLDEAGQITTGETVEALSRVDLTQRPIPGAAERRVLVLARSGDSSDQKLCDHFGAAGVQLSVAPGDGYGPMMQYVQLSELPEREIADSLAWLREAPRTASGIAAGAPPASLASADLMQDGIAIRETPVTLALPSGPVRAIVTEPAGTGAEVCAVFLNGGSDRRIGPNRMWVATARRWAARGVASVRVDPIAIGDSDGPEDRYERLWAYYEPEHVRRTVELLDALHARGLPDRFVMVGFCSGGYRSFQTALADDRVVGVFAIHFPFFRWSWWTVNVRNWWVGDREPQANDGPIKLPALLALKALWRFLMATRRRWLRLNRRRLDRTDAALDRLRARGTEMLLLFKSKSWEYDELEQAGRIARMGAMDNVTVRRMPGSDQRFRPRPLQQYVSDALDEALGRVLAGAPETAGADMTVHPPSKLLSGARPSLLAPARHSRSA